MAVSGMLTFALTIAGLLAAGSCLVSPSRVHTCDAAPSRAVQGAAAPPPGRSTSLPPSHLITPPPLDPTQEYNFGPGAGQPEQMAAAVTAGGPGMGNFGVKGAWSGLAKKHPNLAKALELGIFFKAVEVRPPAPSLSSLTHAHTPLLRY